MKTQYLLNPHKHVRFSDSLIGLGGIIYARLLDAPKTLDGIWVGLQKLKSDGCWNGYISFSNMVLAIDVLYACKLVKMVENDKIAKNDS